MPPLRTRAPIGRHGTYTKVLDSDGNVVLDNTQTSNENMSEKTAYYLTYMMEETVKDGTGTEAQVAGVDTAGKTGTTSDDKDRWFAGLYRLLYRRGMVRL